MHTKKTPNNMPFNTVLRSEPRQKDSGFKQYPTARSLGLVQSGGYIAVLRQNDPREEHV